MLRLRLQKSDPREMIGVDCHEDTLRGLGTTQLRESRVKRSLSQGASNLVDPLTQNECSHTTGPRLCECHSWVKLVVVCHLRGGPDGHQSSHQVMNRHRLLPTPSWEPVQLGSSWGPTTWGHFLWESARPTSDCSNIGQASTTASTPCTSQLWLLYSSLSSA